MDKLSIYQSCKDAYDDYIYNKKLCRVLRSISGVLTIASLVVVVNKNGITIHMAIPFFLYFVMHFICGQLRRDAVNNLHNEEVLLSTVT